MPKLSTDAPPVAKSLSAFLQRAMSAVFCVRTQREVRTVNLFLLGKLRAFTFNKAAPDLQSLKLLYLSLHPLFCLFKVQCSSSELIKRTFRGRLLEPFDLQSRPPRQEISISLTNWENRTNSFNKKCSHISLCLILPLHNLPLLDLHRERGSALACEAERLGIPYMGITQDREAKSTQLAVSQYLKQYRDPKKVFLHVSSPCASGSQSAMEPKGVITFRSKKFDQPRKLWVKPCGSQQERGQTSCTLSPGWALLLRGLQKL